MPALLHRASTDVGICRVLQLIPQGHWGPAALFIATMSTLYCNLLPAVLLSLDCGLPLIRNYPFLYLAFPPCSTTNLVLRRWLDSWLNLIEWIMLWIVHLFLWAYIITHKAQKTALFLHHQHSLPHLVSWLPLLPFPAFLFPRSLCGNGFSPFPPYTFLCMPLTGHSFQEACTHDNRKLGKGSFPILGIEITT